MSVIGRVALLPTPLQMKVRAHYLKKLFAASLEARFLAAAACNRSASEFNSNIRSVSSSTESRDRSWPISWVIFFRGRSSSSIAMCLLLFHRRDRLQHPTALVNQVG